MEVMIHGVGSRQRARLADCCMADTMTTDRQFAAIHARGMLAALARYARAGIYPSELLVDYEIAVETFGLRADELGGGTA